MATDFVNYDTPSVSIVGNPQHAVTRCAYWASLPQAVTPAGTLVTVDSSTDVDELAIKLPDSKGDFVSHVLTYEYDPENTDDPYLAVEVIHLDTQITLSIPEDALGESVEADDYLVADVDGLIHKKASATDFVVFQALSTGTVGGDGFFRVQPVLSQIADA